jgi:Fe-S cluster biogenesis protein NfuA
MNDDQLAAALEPVRQRVRGHGGDVTLGSPADGVVDVEFHGACRGCPAIALTFAGSVQPALLGVPGVATVRASQALVSAHALARIERLLRTYGDPGR